MKVKTFHALTMQDALRAIKEELGPDAIILSSKEVSDGGRILRVFNHPVLEVMAAAEYESPHSSREGARAHDRPASVRTPGTGPAAIVPPNTFQQALQGVLAPTRAMIPGEKDKKKSPKKAAVSGGKLNSGRQIRAVYEELNQLVRTLSPGMREPAGGHSLACLSTLRHSLQDQGMQLSTIEWLMGEALKSAGRGHRLDEPSMRQALHQEIVRRVHVSGPLLDGHTRPAIGLLIGPSGAGKTSAVAKLAAYYRLEQRKSVALITFDTYRETAVEQLRRYAKIIGVPFACALSARQVQAGLRRHGQVDLVLMDLPGIAPADLTLASDLCRRLKHHAITTHLVLPASTRAQEACRMTGQMRVLPHLRLLFTKLDETESYGTMFEVAHAMGVPLSYWSLGRRVPGDIEVASSEYLAARLTTCGLEGGQRHVSQSGQFAEGKPVLAATGTDH